MGGNIKFVTPTKRYSVEEYNKASSEVIEKLSQTIFTVNCADKNIQIVKSYKTKESFGDCDIVVNSEYLKSNYIESIVSSFKLKVGDWSKNGNVFSFVYEKMQVDLIITPSDEFQTSLDYFAWNDLGNLIGRQSKRIGIKFGHDGSYIIVKDKDQVLGKILLTKNISKLFDVLGLDYTVWKNGFDTLEDIFKFVASGKYFNPDIYLFENRNAISRERDRKRATYNSFLKWCETYTGSVYNHKEKSERTGYNIVQPYFDRDIIPNFPQTLELYNSLVATHKLNILYKEKFNGVIINKLTGLEGKELGAFMSWVKTKKIPFIKYKEKTCNLIIKRLHYYYINDIMWTGIPLKLVYDISKNEGMIK